MANVIDVVDVVVVVVVAPLLFCSASKMFDSSFLMVSYFDRIPQPDTWRIDHPS